MNPIIMNEIIPIEKNEAPQTVIVYKTYTPAVKRAQAKYRNTDKGKIARLRASKMFLKRHRDRINERNRVKVKCPHCDKIYATAYLPRHVKQRHAQTS